MCVCSKCFGDKFLGSPSCSLFTSAGGEWLKQTFLEQQRRNLSQYDKVSQDCYVSRIEHLTLSQYASMKTYFCKARHTQPCEKGCEGLVKVANKVLIDGFMLFKDAFLLSSPGVTYTALHACRKLLSMTLAAVGVGKMQDGTFHYYLVEKGTVRYTTFQWFANKFLQNSKNLNKNSFSKGDLKKLLLLAETDSEKEKLKFVAVKAGGLSVTAAGRTYGFRMQSERQRKVFEAMEHAQMIKESIENIARIKDKTLVSSLGFDVSESEEETDQSSSEDDCDTNDQVNNLNLNNHNVEQSTLLDILKESDFN